MDYQQIRKDLLAIENRKTKDIDQYNKKLIKNKEDVSSLEKHILEEQIVYRTFFQVSLGLMKTYEEQFNFIEEKASLLNDWWHVDMLCQFIKGPIDFDFAFNKAKVYVNSNLPFLRRWGYVLFLKDLYKQKDNVPFILSLFKDDDEYYVQMAEAWLLASIASYNFDLAYEFLKNSKMKYNILGKAIQKICDSFMISDEQKTKVKKLRDKLRNN